MKLTVRSLKNDRKEWEDKGFILPRYDIEELVRNTEEAPEWIHLGAGNIFRGYIACLADDLIGQGEMKSGIIAADCFNTEPVGLVFRPFDRLCLLVGLRANGGRYLRVIGSVGKACAAVGEGMEELKKAARSDSLKMISFTITEKGYAAADMNGDTLAPLARDISEGPDSELSTALGKVSSLLLERFRSGAKPIALVSMDNCSRNGDKLREGVLFTVRGWCDNGFTDGSFYEYVSDGKKVSFPWTMIDKITPRPDPAIAAELAAMGIPGMQPSVTSRGTYTAPFVNAEMPQYLVIEDDFPNGRPPLEKAGVYLTDRQTVDRAEKMKVMTCLNPLHTALALFGCLLGYRKISDEMNDPDLKALVYRLGHREGLPVAADPGIIQPEAFLNEVLTERLPNPGLPDTPQRIASDTSRKISVRFGETVRAYATKGSAGELTAVPLVIAAWLRYLTGTDDNGSPMELSPDPMLGELQKHITPGMFGGRPLTDAEKSDILTLLGNEELFGADLVSAGLGGRIVGYFTEMLSRKGAVRDTLRRAVRNR
ncbi:MAG: mannitol dehydrogenase family protein [Ruminiclostridium sp.]|nr:mannitol dehydrogenase family protein [Ruminiclostridium sp.]